MSRLHYSLAHAVLFVVICGASTVSAQTAPSLGNAASFAVLAGTTVTNTGSSVISGNVGVSPNNAIVGFPPGTVTTGSALHAGNATAAAAQVSVTSAYLNLEGQAPTQILTGQDLGGLTLMPGVYKFATSAQLTGTLTLNALGDPNAVFIFQMGSTLTTASASSVEMINSGSACNVYWQVGSSATLGTTTEMVGNILALASITLNTGATVTGRTLARSGAVTLDTNTVSAATCGGPAFGGTCPVIGINPQALAGGTVGLPYTQRILANSGSAPYVYTVSAGTLPTGLTLSTTGFITGTPTSSLPQTFTIKATDLLSCSAVKQYTFLFGVAVPTMPQVLLVVLAIGLMAIGYLRLRQTTSVRR